MQDQIIEGFRLSPQQRRLWLLQNGSKSFRAQCAVDLAGSLDAAVLRATLNDVVMRHEILRTGFDCPKGRAIPIQVISETPELSYHLIDLTCCPAQDQRPVIEEAFRRQREIESDYKRASLAQFAL